MNDPLLQPVVLLTLSNEGVAHSIVGVLTSEGVEAWAVGGTPVEAPASIRVMVLRADEELARAILQTVRLEAAAINWDQVDVGEEESPPADHQTRAGAGGGDACGHQAAGRPGRLSLAGLGAAGAGAGLIGAREVVFTTLPAAAKPLPGCALVAVGVVWCIARARRRS
ncbi:MAG: hypothetical protein AB7G11_07290 [Phycisphaerales bacterium]